MPGHPHRSGVALVVSLLLGTLTACGDGGGGIDPDPGDVVVSLDISPDSADVALGAVLQLGALARNARDEVVSVAVAWTSSDATIAAVDDQGRVEGVAPGTATITARGGGQAATATVVSFDPSPPPPPDAVEATALSDEGIEVRWIDTSASETGFLVYREAVGAAGAGSTSAAPVEAGRVGADVTRFVDGGLAADTPYRYAVEACNAAGCSGRIVAPEPVATYPTLAIETPAELPQARLGVVYGLDLQATGPPATWSLVEGGLPGGLELDPAGSLAGTPEEGGVFEATLSAQGGGQLRTRTFRLTVLEPPVPTTTALRSGIRGLPYAERLTATRGDGAYVWSLVEGALPAGIALAPDGTLSGSPAALGVHGFTAQVVSGGFEATVALELAVFDPLEVTTTTLPGAVVDWPFEATLAAAGGDGAYTWALVAGTLPAGVALSADGVVSGTPTALGDHPLTVEVTSGDGQRVEVAFTLTVREQPVAPVVVTATLPDAGAGAPYAATLQASEGDGSFAWSRTGGSLPAGVSLSPDGALTGTPAVAGLFEFTVQVTSAGLTGSATLEMRVHPPLLLTTTSLPPGTRGVAYSAALSTTGGDGSPTFALVGGSLPPGLSLAPAGVVSGTPSASGTGSFRIAATNALGQRAERNLSLPVFEVLAVGGAGLPDGAVGVGYSESLSASGGDGDYTWAVVAGTLPSGLSLAPGTGVIAGTPTTEESRTFTVRVQSGDGQEATAQKTLTVGPSPPSVVTASLPNGTVGAPYSETLAAGGGDGSYTWSLASGSLPAGLSLSGAGVVSGTPSSAGTSSFTVQVTSGGQSATRGLSITVDGAGVSFARSHLPGGHLGQGYSAPLEPATGGTGSFTYQVTAGALPAGLALDPSTGIVSGVPTSAGMAFFEVTASSGGSDVSVVFGLTISTAPPGAFNLFGVNVGDQVPTAAVRTAIDGALARYEAIINGDAPAVALPSSGLGSACGGNGGLFHGRTIDDAEVLIDIGPIDGSGGILGQAGICLGRSAAPLTLVSQLILDSQDLAALSASRLFALVWHEIGHGMGIAGGVWNALGLMTDYGGPDPRYTGAAGVAAYQGTLGGSGDPPIEADGGGGTRDSHWDEAFFDTEVMTGWLDVSANPVSVMTVGALQDLGWSGIDFGAADAYSIPGCSPACTAPAPAPGAPLALTRIPLGDDVIRQPIVVVGPGGTIRRIEPGRP